MHNDGDDNDNDNDNDIDNDNDNDNNNERRTEELEALRSLYDDKNVFVETSFSCEDSEVWKIRLSSNIVLELNFLSVSKYPSLEAPIPNLVGMNDDEGTSLLLRELQDMSIDTPGSEIGILWAEYVRAKLASSSSLLLEKASSTSETSEKNKESESRYYCNKVVVEESDKINGLLVDEKTSSQHCNTHNIHIHTNHQSVAIDNNILAIVEFHHMLIGASHKKEAQVISAAITNGVRGYIYMGGPSYAVIITSDKEDLLTWLHDCKKVGKVGTIRYWKLQFNSNIECEYEWPSKLKVIQYANSKGKGDKPDMGQYKHLLVQLGIAYPLPRDCKELL